MSSGTSSGPRTSGFSAAGRIADACRGLAVFDAVRLAVHVRPARASRSKRASRVAFRPDLRRARRPIRAAPRRRLPRTSQTTDRPARGPRSPAAAGCPPADPAREARLRLRTPAAHAPYDRVSRRSRARRRAIRLQTGQERGALHLGAGDGGRVVDRLQRAAGNGERRRSFLAAMRAPIRLRGSMMRRIGRVRSDSSPSIVARKRVGGKDPAQQSKGRSGVPGVERRPPAHAARAVLGR